jgi:aminoglycoside phosphotransferase (APT) family kinase protein
MPPDRQDRKLTDDLAERLGRVLRTSVEGLVRLSGGASRETWAFDSVDFRTGTRKELILRRDPPGAPRNGMELEARLLNAAARVGVPVPGVRAAGPAASDRLETSYLVMDRITGETIARKILRDPQYVHTRSVLAQQSGETLAKLHSIDAATITGLEPADQLQKYELLYADLSVGLGFRSAVFQWALKWLRENQPENRPQKVVHGDFRLGNLIVDGNGLVSVLDWELAHIGDPMEDLGWLCVKAWRFGAEPEVGGFGTIEQLLRGYTNAGGVADEAAFRWWIVAGTLIWGVMCMMQANAHVSGAMQSVELATIGRRVAEQEHDLLLLLAPDELLDAKANSQRADEVPAASDDFGVPSAQHLVLAVQQFLQADVLSATEGRVQFQTRVAINALGIVARQLGQQSTPGTADTQSIAEMATATVQRVAVSNPKW